MTEAAAPRTAAAHLVTTDAFGPRHLGPNEAEVAEMLRLLSATSLDVLIHETLPEGIRLKLPLDLPAPRGEREATADLRALADRNLVFRSFLGMGW